MTTANISIKNVQQTSSGFVVWSKNARHRLPMFVPFNILKGINMFKAAAVTVAFHKTDAGRLVADDIEVTETK